MTRFTKGKSGNPAGRPKGITDKRTELANLLLPNAEKLVNKAIELALNGDPQALRLCIERLIPKATNETMIISLPELDPTNTNAASEIGAEIVKAFSGKQIGFDQVKNLISVLNYYKENPLPIADADLERAKIEMQKIIERHKRDY